MKFKIVEYNSDVHDTLLEQFFIETDVPNNSSVERLGYTKRHKSKMFLTLADNKIAAMCYAHDFSDYYAGAYRIFTRTATLPEYRSKGFPHSRTMISAAGISAYSTPYQVDYAHNMGAKRVYFTTNALSGSTTSQKLTRYLDRIVHRDPRFDLLETTEIYGVVQRVWKLNFRDLFDLTSPI
jgi:hypothetical protein